MNNESIYYFDEEAQMNVTSNGQSENSHFAWWIKNKTNIGDWRSYLLLNQEEQDDLIQNYVADYIPS